MIKQQTIQEILETARIEEVVGIFVSLRKRGVNHIGLCPFHNEKTPSFTVSPAKGIYKCFGCGKAGNSVNFLMEHEHYTYPEALRYLADKYQIEIEEEQQTPEQVKALSEQESLFHVTSFAQKYFSNNLFNTEEGKAIGLSYFKEREFKEDTVKKFQLGYCIDKWEDFTQHALNNGYKLTYLDKTGLTIVKEDKKYDRFRGRVVFPIHNLSGRVIGYGARILKSDSTKPKYVNSPESEIYNKSKVLYGIYFSGNAIIKNDNCFLVEGYTDVISMHQAGIENVVSSSGTSLTTDQIRLIKRYTNNVTILFDGDPAGIKASFRGVDMILEQGMNVKIVLFPEGEDPDSYVRTNRISEVEKFITKGANDFIIFKTNLLLKESANVPIKKASLIKEIVNSIALIPDGIFRSVYIRECSNVMEIPEQSLMNELNKILRRRYKTQHKIPPEEEVQQTEYTAEKQIRIDNFDCEFQEKDIIRLILTYGDQIIPPEGKDDLEISVAEFIISDIKNDELRFHNPYYQSIFDDYVTELEKNVVPTGRHFINHPDNKIAKLAIDLIATPYELSKHWEKNMISVATESDKLKKATISSILSFKAKKVDLLIIQTQQKIKEANDNETIIILLQKLQNLKEISKEINARLGRVITK
ncbi:MAG: DNA primase [Bacteroidales bacterium]|nr:DNA primase [Bacteroidales bacterium]